MTMNLGPSRAAVAPLHDPSDVLALCSVASEAYNMLVDMTGVACRNEAWHERTLACEALTRELNAAIARLEERHESH